MSVHSGTLTSRLVHPTSPVLLTKNGPLKTLLYALVPSLNEAGWAAYAFQV